MPRISVVPTPDSPGRGFLDSLAALPVDAEICPLDQARGDYLLLLSDDDADERLVPHGVIALLEALGSSGSDVAIGRPGHAATATSVAATPSLLGHDVSGAALWRRAWWQRAASAWPHERALQRGALTRALLRARAIDVVAEPVTAGQTGVRRDRRTRPSPSAAEVAARADRVADLVQLGHDLEPELAASWFTTVLLGELRAALTVLPEADPATRRRLVDIAADALSEHPDRVGRDVRAIHRLQLHLAGRRLVPELLDAVKADRSGELTHRPPLREGDAYYGDYPYRTDDRLAVPREVYRLETELALRARVESVRWEGDRLHVEGHAYVGLLDLDSHDADRLDLALVRAGDERRVPLDVERVHRPDITRQALEAFACYDWAGFRTAVDVDALRDDGRWAYGSWRLEARVTCGGIERTRIVSATASGSARRPELRALDDVRIVPVTGRGTFAVEVDTLPATVTSMSADGDSVRLEGSLRRAAARGEASLVVVRDSGSAVLTVPVRVRGRRRRAFVVAVSVSALRDAVVGELDRRGRWSLRLALPGGTRPVPLRAATGLEPLVVDGATTVEVEPAVNGRLAVTAGPRRPRVDSARWTGDELELTGRWPCDAADRLVLVSRDGTREHPMPVETAATAGVSAGRFVARLRPGAVPSLAGDLPLTQGGWLPVVRRDDSSCDQPLTAEPPVLAALPMTHTIAAKSFSLLDEGGALELSVGPDLDDGERGAVNQQRLRAEDFPRFLVQGLRDEVLFESYGSRAYADNARAICEELLRRGTGLRCRWVVADGQTALPPGVEAVRRGARGHYEALARSRYVVVPNYRPLESWLRTPDGQVVVQTWHGAPFKKIGLDNPRGADFSSRDYVQMLRRETSRWDYLLSPNPSSTPILRRAFGYDGEMLETGYPRTDVFHSSDRAGTAASVREQLGVPEGSTVVLYAPTMRDDHNYGGNRFRLDLRLDLAAARLALGDDHVLWVRRHAKVVDAVAVDGRFARDVSAWPDVNELLLATDVLVTDYSSLMFDFANTRRPMLFFTYDLDDYRDRLRGLYYDVGRLPGPLLRTSDDVVAAIRDAEVLRAEHDRTYAEFVDEFCVWDDGKASARFVDQVFAAHL